MKEDAGREGSSCVLHKPKAVPLPRPVTHFMTRMPNGFYRNHSYANCLSHLAFTITCICISLKLLETVTVVEQ